MGRACSWQAAGDTNLGVADTSVGPAAIHRDLCRMGKWAVENSPIHWYILEPTVCPRPGWWHRLHQQVTEASLAFTHTGAVPRSGHPNAQCETQTELGVQQRPQRDAGTATSLLQGKDEAAGIVQPEESSGRLSSTLIIWSGGARKMEPGSCQWCPGQDRREWAHTGTVRLHLSTRTYLYCEADWELQQVAQGDRVSFLGDPKPSGWTLFWPTRPRWDGWSRGLGHDFQRSLPTSTSLWFCE